MAFSIKKRAPFVIEGEKGNYTIPPITTLSMAEVGEIMELKPDTPVAERLTVVKSFLLKMAPGLKDEENLGDYGYAQIFQAYEREMGLGK